MPGEVEPKIVEAVAVSSSMARINGKTSLAQDIEKAMSRAVILAGQEGISNPDEIRSLMLEARERVKEEHKRTILTGNPSG